MAHRRLHGCKNHVQANVNQIHPGERDDQVPSKNHAFIQHMIENVEQRQVILDIIASKDHTTPGSAHSDSSPSVRETKEYGGHGPVHSIRRRFSQPLENFVNTDSSFFWSRRLISSEV